MPKWSPDGRRIVFDGNAGDGWELFLINADGSGLERLTTNDSIDANTTWSPDGKSIAYECHVGELRTICLLDLDSGDTQRLF